MNTYQPSRFLRLIGLIAAICLSAHTGLLAQQLAPFIPQTGNAIFIHPDGTSLSHWTAARIRWKGPDGWLNWDRMPHMAAYASHMANTLSGTSHGGGTIHAYGVKVPADSYGMFGQKPITSLSGKPYSIMTEAKEAGLACGLVNSGDLYEPGTGCYVASVESRSMKEEIVKQIIESDIDVIMGGGEGWLLPEGVKGVHGPGKRTDGLDLIKQAREQGYTILYNRKDLINLPRGTKKVLGVFAHGHTFNDKPEEDLREAGLPLYVEGAPTIAEMTRAAMRVLGDLPQNFLLVVEEEATDNFSNYNNAQGALEALRRSDDAIGEAQAYLATDPQTLLITAADSSASGMQLLGGWQGSKRFDDGIVPARAHREGGHQDGKDGTESVPFMSAPDASGNRHPFSIIWATNHDVAGGVLARAQGINAELVHGTIDNTDIYRIMYATLFGELLP